MELRKYSLEGMVMKLSFWKNKKIIFTHTRFKGNLLSLYLQKQELKEFTINKFKEYEN